MSVLTEYSLWFLPICIAGGLSVALLLYYRSAANQIIPKHIIQIAFVLRTIFISILLFLLLGPFIEQTKRSIVKPTIVFLQDNSNSIVMHNDSLYYKTTYKTNVEQLTKALSNNYATHTYTFGEHISDSSLITYNQKRTNISNALQQIYSRYFNANLGAIILASDGLYNTGDNPLYSPIFESHIPIYTIALGNPNQVRDNVISDVQHNSVVFKNIPFTARVFIESHNLQGKKSTITILEGSKQVFQTNIQSNSNTYVTSIDCKLTTQSLGQVLYTVRIENHDNEITYKNNTFLFSVDVMESQQNILILYESVHPDVAAIRRALETNKNYSVTVSSTQEFAGNINNYNCIIFHGLPQSYGKSKELVEKAKSFSIPALYTYNYTMNLALLDILNVGLSIRQRSNTADEVQALYNTENTIFDIDQESKELIESAPPLFAPYGEYVSNIQSRVVLWQRMQQIQTQRPLLQFFNTNGYKTAIFTGEGLWRWRIHAYKKNKSFTAFDVLINNCVNYLALTQKQELFRVQTKPMITENQDIIFRAELYNKSYEPIPNKEIRLRIWNQKGKEFPYVFTSNNDYYSLQVGKMPIGTYSYTATVEIEGSKYEQKGSFMILPLQLEYTQTRANHALLQTISLQTGGSMLQKEQMQQIYDSIQSNKNIVPIAYTSKTRTLLLDSFLLLITLIVFAGTEWFLRKFYGSY